MTEYGWNRGDECRGPFSTKAAALADAVNELGAGSTIEIGTMQHANPVDYIPSDVEDLLILMDENTYLGLAGSEFFKAKTGAQTALTKALKNWAAKYVTSTLWVLKDSKAVVL